MSRINRETQLNEVNKFFRVYVFFWEKVLIIDGWKSSFKGLFFEAEHKCKYSQGKYIHLGANLKPWIQVELLGSSIQGSCSFLDILLDLWSVFFVYVFDDLDIVVMVLIWLNCQNHRV